MKRLQTHFFNLFPDFLLSATLLYTCLASAVYISTQRPCFNYNNATYFTLLLVATALSLYHFFSEFRSQSKSEAVSISSLSLIATVGVLIAALIYFYRIQFWQELPIWLDEFVQAYAQQLSDLCSLSVISAGHHQPPTDFILSYFNLKSFGSSVLSLRINALIFSTLSVFLLLFLLIKTKIEKWLTPSVLLLFITQPILIIYSFEARPYSLSVFCLLLYIWYFYQHLTASRKTHPALFSSLFLYLSSIGLQPVITGLSLLLPFLFLRSSYLKDKIRKLVLLNLSVFLLMSPIFIGIYAKSKDIVFVSDQTFFSSFNKVISSLSLLTYERLSFYLGYFKGTLPIILFALLLCATLLVRRLLKKKSCPTFTDWFWFAYAMLFAVFFVLLFNSTWSLVNWFDHEKYFINFYPALLFFSVLGISQIFQRILFVSFSKKILIGVMFFGLTLFSVYRESYGLYKPLSLVKSVRVDWKSFFSDMKDDPSPKLALSLPYSLLGYYEGTMIYPEIYGMANNLIPECLQKEALSSIGFDLNCVKNLPVGSSIYLTIKHMGVGLGLAGAPAQMDTIFEQVGHHYSTKTYQNKNFRTIKIQVKQNPLSELEAALQNIISYDPRGEQNAYILFSLLHYYLQNNDLEKSQLTLAAVKNLNYREKLSTALGDIDYKPSILSAINKAEEQITKIAQ